MDGTGNEVGENESNILKLYKALKKDDAQLVHYIPGVGTMDSQNLFGRGIQKIKSLLGLAFGLGLEDDVLDAYRYICRNYRTRAFYSKAAAAPDAKAFHDDQIYIFGFSRGAYAARVLAGFIHNFGLIPVDRLHLAAQAFRAYRAVTDSDPDEKPDVVFQNLREYELVLKPNDEVPVRYLGLFDTVSSMVRVPPIAFSRKAVKRWFRHIKDYRSLIDYGSHANVDNNPTVRIVSHALAVNERRAMFRPQFWYVAMDDNGQPTGNRYFRNRYKRSPHKRTQFVEQRWFPGFHSDVGGSALEERSGIGKVALVWMIDHLARSEAAANTEDALIEEERAQKATRKNRVIHAAGQPMPAGLTFRKNAYRDYILGQNPSRLTPRKKPYSKPDPCGPMHNSVFGTPVKPKGTWAWIIFEVIPKTIVRRKWPPGWNVFRRGIIWSLPLWEPRLIPDHHILDDSVRERCDKMKYNPINVRRYLDREAARQDTPDQGS